MRAEMQASCIQPNERSPLPSACCPAWQKLFYSSRFNYDSDEDEEEQQEQQEPQRQAGPAAAAAAAAGDEAPVEVALPPPRGVRVKTAEFIKSSVNVEQCPPPRFPEFAGGRFWVYRCLHPSSRASPPST